MKYSDDLYDVNHDIKLASVFGILCAIASAVATVGDVGAAYIFIAILIGNLIALKVDGVHHLITLIVFIIICLMYGVGELNGHEMISKVTANEFLNLFFEYRFVMKIAIFLLAICGAFNVLIFICFIIFELAYLCGGMVFEKFN